MSSFAEIIIKSIDSHDLHTKLDTLLSEHGCSIDYGNLLKEKELRRCPFCAYVVLRYANAQIDATSTEEQIQRIRDSQAIWLKYCLSSDMGYIFAILRPYGIDRETEVAKILRTSLMPDNGPLVGVLTKEGRRYYRQRIFEWFIRRYAWGHAWTAVRGAGMSLATRINLIYPRLLGGIIIGFLPLVPESSVWKLAKEYAFTTDCCPPRTLILWGVSLLLVFLYIFHECFKVTEDTATTARRALGTLVIGLIYSVATFGLIYWPLMYRLDDYVARGDNFWTYAPFFCPAALLIGVFLQFFWEDKTITEPL